MYISNIIVIAVILLALALMLFSYWTRVKQRSAKPSASLMRGLYCLSLGNKDQALDEFRRLALTGVQSPEIYVTMAVLYRQKGELKKAIHIGESLMLREDLPRTSVSVVLRELIMSYRAAGTLNKAEEWLKQLPEVITEPEVALVKADLASYKGWHEEAINQYQKYERMTGGKAGKEIAREYISLAEKAGDNSHRVKALKNALKHDPDNRKVYFELADLYIAEGKPKQALAEYKLVIERELLRTRDDTRIIEAAFFAHDSLDSLYELLSGKVYSGSSDPATYLYLCDYYLKKGNRDKAEELLKNYITDIGNRAVILKAYAKLTQDPLLLRVSQSPDNYACAVCESKYSEYTDVCTQCGSMHSLNYI